MHYCGEPHFNDECPKYSTATDRRFRIRFRCFYCLSGKHKFHECTVSRPCVYCGTEKSHHRSLCSNQFPDSNRASKSTGNKKRETTAVGLAEEPKTNDNEGSEANTTSTDLCTLAAGESVQLQTAMVQIKGKTDPHQFSAKALIDTASTRSYITEDTIKKLQIRSKPGETLIVNRFVSEKKKEITVKSAQVQIVLRDGNSLTLTVNAVPNITGKIRRVAINPKKVDNFLWRNLPLADSWPSKEEKFEIQLLIGMDYYLDIVTLEKIQLSENLFLIGSKLGWLMAGRSGEEGANQVSGRASEESTFLGIVYTDQHNAEIGFQCRIDDHRLIAPNLEDLWKLDTIGIHDCPVELDDDKALESFNNTVKFHDKRYFVTSPWKSIAKELPDNYFLAKGRLQSLLTKFKQNPELLGKYNEIIASQLQKGVIEKINHNCCDSELVHYIPHHAVVTRLKTTTKVRIVYDASAKTKRSNGSLNEYLYRRPTFLQNLCGLLLRFSLCSIVLLSDIEKAFLQVGLEVPDREVTRFLWLQDPTKQTLENSLQVYRFCRVPFGVISSPFLLGATGDHHLKKANSSIAEEIRRNIYVDNVLLGANTVEQALNAYKDAKSLFAEASMNLREWASNSPEFLVAIPEVDRVAPAPNLMVLGINWDCQKDQISILGASDQGCDNAKTKRDVVKIVAQFFDPLGMFLPVTARCKLLIRKLWHDVIGWDDSMKPEHQQVWSELIPDLKRIPLEKLPRKSLSASVSEQTKFYLLCFVDASQNLYAATIYLHVRYGQSATTQLIFAKSRLSPQRPSTTIPRLELMAMLIGVRVLSFCEKELRLPISRKTLWSDSQCTLHWTTTVKPLCLFVKNRVAEIKKATNVEYRYVNTDSNPADWATRGKQVEELTSFWWEGPSWLKTSPEKWPQWNMPPIDNDMINRKESSLDVLTVNGPMYEASLLCPVDSKGPFDLDAKRYSSLNTVLRITAFALRFISNCRSSNKRSGFLTASEILFACKLWEKSSQERCYGDDFEAIKTGKSYNFVNRPNLQLDETGILRCYLGLSNANFEPATKWPTLMHQKDPFTD